MTADGSIATTSAASAMRIENLINVKCKYCLCFSSSDAKVRKKFQVRVKKRKIGLIGWQIG